MIRKYAFRGCMKRLGILIVSLILLSSCTTPYQDGQNGNNPMGGYGSEKGIGKLEKVYFRATEFTSPQLASQYAIRRAAEIAREYKAPYFAAYETVSYAAQNIKTQQPVSDNISGLYKPSSYTSYFYVSYHQKKEPGDFVVSEILDNNKS